MPKCTEVEISVIVKDADECSRIAGLIADHYGAIGVLYGELANLSAKHEEEKTEEVRSREWDCPNCPPGVSHIVGSGPCVKCGTPSPWSAVHDKHDTRDQTDDRGTTARAIETCPHGCGHDLQLSRYLSFDAVTESHVWGCPKCERAFIVTNHGDSVFEAIATCDRIVSGMWRTDCDKLDKTETSHDGAADGVLPGNDPLGTFQGEPVIGRKTL